MFKELDEAKAVAAGMKCVSFFLGQASHMMRCK